MNFSLMALIYLRIRSHVKASMVLTRADHLFTHNYIRSLINIILRHIIMFWVGFEPSSIASYCIYIYIYIYTMYYNYKLLLNSLDFITYNMCYCW